MRLRCQAEEEAHGRWQYLVHPQPPLPCCMHLHRERGQQGFVRFSAAGYANCHATSAQLRRLHRPMGKVFRAWSSSAEVLMARPDAGTTDAWSAGLCEEDGGLGSARPRREVRSLPASLSGFRRVGNRPSTPWRLDAPRPTPSALQVAGILGPRQ